MWEEKKSPDNDVNAALLMSENQNQKDKWQTIMKAAASHGG